MANIHHRSSDKYLQKQSVRDEANAPVYVEAPGDTLIQELYQKQTNVKITIEEQLNMRQNFTEGESLEPCPFAGLNTLKDVKSLVEDNVMIDERPNTEKEVSELDDLSYNPKKINVEQLQKDTGLSRSELEIGFTVKPNSLSTKLYEFALKNKKVERGSEIPNHPINKIKEIEEEYFGHLKEGRESNQEKKVVEEGRKARKRKRKRKKKTHDLTDSQKISEDDNDSDAQESCTSSQPEDSIKPGNTSKKVSLWDVQDMRNHEHSAVHTCKPQSLYTVREGKIVKLSQEESKAYAKN